MTHRWVTFADLTDGVPRSVREQEWDWVMSIEVAEHVPRSAEARFVHTILSAQPRGVVLSWALPGQGGFHHVNCQSNEYVECVRAHTQTL